MSLREEIENIVKTDPAARSSLEVVLCYPGFHALISHRICHAIWRTNFPPFMLVARFFSQITRSLTGIEIHPGATIGRRLFIDHGMGVVIGETTIIGNDVVIYQGVTLGGGAEARQGASTRGKKRHPTLGNNVVIGSSAQVIGNINVGNGSRVASSSVVLKDVPDDCVVAGIPARIVYREGQRVSDVLPDIEAEAIKVLKNHVLKLEGEIAELRGEKKKSDISNVTTDFQASGPSDSPPMDAVDAFLWGAGI